MPRQALLEFVGALLTAHLLLGLVACGPANDIREVKADPPRLFDMADRDGDNAITLYEWDVQSERLFATLDVSDDGHLDLQELEAGFHAFDQNNSGTIDVREAPVLVSQADSDGDNLISLDEFRNFDWSNFKGDVNSDGLVSSAEFRKPRRELFYKSDLDRDDRLRRYEFDESARIILFRW